MGGRNVAGRSFREEGLLLFLTGNQPCSPLLGSGCHYLLQVTVLWGTPGALSCLHATACLVLNKPPEGNEPLRFFRCSHNKYLYTTFPKNTCVAEGEVGKQGCWICTCWSLYPMV